MCIDGVAALRSCHVNWDEYGAALFDLDGVLTPTAEVHMRAWNRMFNDFLAQAADKGITGDLSTYTDQDYFAHVDGKPRDEGVRDFLTSRGIELPEGSADDPAEADTVHGLGTRKNAKFAAVLESEGVQPYPGSLRLLEHLRDIGLPMAVVSSSKNAPSVLQSAGIADFFPVVMHGGLAAERGLPGKPRPDTFIAAAQDLGVPTERCVVLEDAVSGVQAGATGDFALVVGVDRGAGADTLKKAGADVVVPDLEDLL